MAPEHEGRNGSPVPIPGAPRGSDLQCGVSMDQIVARHFANDTQLASLELGIDPPSLLGRLRRRL